MNLHRHLASRLSPRVEVTAFGRVWRILFTHDALLDLFDLTGLDAMAGEVNLVRPSSKLLRAALFVVLRHAGADIVEKQAGELLRLGGMAKFRVALIEAWEASMPLPEEVRAEPDKPLSHERLSLMRTWSIARENLRLTAEEWLAMTPRMVNGLTNQRLENMRWQELMMGTIAATTANYSMRAPEKQFSAKDYMIHRYPELQEQKGVSGEEIQSVFASVTNDRETTTIQ